MTNPNIQGSNISFYKENENTRSSELAGRRRTVLICDDQRDLLLMFTIALQESYDVLTAKTGECMSRNIP
jgi:response regulator RpfG family c-di-GMP phosphodiesterase